jgi:hypothetical protein
VSQRDGAALSLPQASLTRPLGRQPVAQYENQTQSEQLPEQALAGQFLFNTTPERPSELHIEYLRRLNDDTKALGLHRFMQIFAERVTQSTRDTDYYRILAELMKLERSGLKLVKERIDLCVDACKKDKQTLPYRYYSPTSGCGFVFIPLLKSEAHLKSRALQNLTLAAAYDVEPKLKRQIGVSFLADTDGYFLLDWCFLEGPFQDDPEIKDLLSKNSPFREVKTERVGRYQFK